MIARNPDDHNDLWLVSKEFFEENYELVIEDSKENDYLYDEFEKLRKTLHNSTASEATKNVKDIIFWGNGDLWKLISKASSKSENWMKSTKAMVIPTGCLVQVTTQQGNNVAEAITYVPDAAIEEHKDEDGNVISRSIIRATPPM